MSEKTLIPKDEWRYFIFSDGKDCRVGVVCWERDGYEAQDEVFQIGELPNHRVTASDMKRIGLNVTRFSDSSVYQLEITPTAT